ncbi:MAG: N-acetyltransferase, partial [Clostridia bacterium]|nr:N-acetyltransferase [Clostridia bacterium]
RLATLSDLDKILDIYACAREFMKNTGNPTQWKDSEPSKETLINDIENKNLYVIEENEIVAAFAFIIGFDATYSYIENGEWLSDEIYGAIHRIASNGKVKGVFSTVISYCEATIKHLRIDTHKDNKIMQHLISEHGFKKCGIIYTSDNTPRIAYEKIAEN